MLELYQQWCKETKRNGAILIGGSIRDFFKWLDKRHEIVELEPFPILIGHLKIQFGINSYHIAKPGHPVYEFNNKYQVELTHDKLPTMVVPFYKETLKSNIKFL